MPIKARVSCGCAHHHRSPALRNAESPVAETKVLGSRCAASPASFQLVEVGDPVGVPRQYCAAANSRSAPHQSRRDIQFMSPMAGKAPAPSIARKHRPNRSRCPAGQLPPALPAPRCNALSNCPRKFRLVAEVWTEFVRPSWGRSALACEAQTLDEVVSLRGGRGCPAS